MNAVQLAMAENDIKGYVDSEQMTAGGRFLRHQTERFGADPANEDVVLGILIASAWIIDAAQMFDSEADKENWSQIGSKLGLSAGAMYNEARKG